MKSKNIPSSESQWGSLAWKTVTVNSSQDDIDLDDSKFLNAKNHYDDPNADGSTLGGEGNGTIEGADDPGIFLGLEVIDGSRYQVEKVSVSDNPNAGFITRLVLEGDEKVEVDNTKETGERTKKPPKKKKDSKNKKSSKIEVKDLTMTDQNSKSVGEKKLTRTQRNRLKFEEIIAKRKEKQAARKRKRLNGASTETSESQHNHAKEEKIPNSKNNKKAKQNKADTCMEEAVEESSNREGIHSIQTSWAIGTGGVYLHDKICSSLHQMGFTSPTPIQASTLAASILGQREIVGAAPTGSVRT